MVPGTIADRSDIHTAEFRPDYWPLLVEIRDLLRERLPGPQYQPEQATPKITHYLKTWPEYYRAVADGRKRFEIRKDDRGFQVGDRLVLQEYEPGSDLYTVRETTVRVTYILRSRQFLPEGYCAMSIEPEQAEGAPEVMPPPAEHGDGDRAAPSPSLREQIGRILATEGAAVPHCGLLALDSLIAAHEVEDERIRKDAAAEIERLRGERDRLAMALFAAHETTERIGKMARSLMDTATDALTVCEDDGALAEAARLRCSLDHMRQALGEQEEGEEQEEKRTVYRAAPSPSLREQVEWIYGASSLGLSTEGTRERILALIAAHEAQDERVRKAARAMTQPCQPEQAEGAPEVTPPPAEHGDGDRAAPSPSLREQVAAAEAAFCQDPGRDVSFIEKYLRPVIAVHEAQDEQVRKAAQLVFDVARNPHGMGHQHWDHFGMHGANCSMCADQRDWLIHLKDAISFLEQALGGRDA